MDGLRHEDPRGTPLAVGGAGDGDDGLAAHRVRLFAAVYRMLGSARAAAQMVADAFDGPAPPVRPGSGAAGDPDARLVREVFGAALRRAEAEAGVRGRRDGPGGPWLPEPVLTGGGVLGPLDSPPARASVSLPRLVLLERLVPAERAAYLLREVFGYGPAQVGAVLGLPEARCAALWRRARQRIRENEGVVRADSEQSGTQRRLTAQELLRALAERDRPALEELLADDVVAWSDGRGEPGAVRRPVLGAAKVGRFLAGLVDRGPEDTQGRVAEVNGEPAVVASAGGGVVGVVVPEFGRRGLVGIRVVADPVRLEYFNRQWAAPESA
jgi:hypothetical protein